MPPVGVAIAMASLIGHAIGEGRHGLAMRRANIAMALAGSYMVVMSVAFLLLRRPMMSYWTDDAAVVAAGVVMLVWIAAFQVFDGLGIIYVNALRGAGDTKVPALLVALHCWGIFITGGYLMATYRPEWGPGGPWMMATVYIILLGLILRWRFNRGAWRSIDLFRRMDGDTAMTMPIPAVDELAISPVAEASELSEAEGGESAPAVAGVTSTPD
jgi:MATE family multidrug resistance protein